MAEDSIAGRLRAFFEADHHAAAVVYLFGSMARGDATATSDVDVAVLCAADPPLTYAGLPLELEGELERLLGRTTQVVVLNHAPADLRARVLRDGLLLLDRDPSARVRFEMQTRNEWFDLEPMLREYRRMTPGGGARQMTDPELLARRLAQIETCVRELREPRTNRALFDLLDGAGWIDAPLATALRNMAGLRNILVYGYDSVDLGIVRDVVERRLDDLVEFVMAVRRRL